MIIGNLNISSKRLNCELVLLVLIVTRLRIGRSRNLGSIWEICKRFITSPNRPDWLWGPASVLFSEQNEPVPQNVKRILYIHLVQRLGMSGAVPLLPTYLRCLYRDRFTFTYAYRRNITDQCRATQRKDKICLDSCWSLELIRRRCY